MNVASSGRQAGRQREREKGEQVDLILDVHSGMLTAPDPQICAPVTQ